MTMWRVIGMVAALHIVQCSVFTRTRANLTQVPVDINSTATSIILNTNSITSIGANTFQRFRQLEIINLDHNEIIYISEHAFNGTILATLHLSYNKFTALPRFMDVGSTLRQLHASHGLIERIGNEFQGVTGLTEIRIGLNELKSIAPDAFIRSAGSLGIIDVGFNQLQVIPPKMFSGMNTLYTFFASGYYFTTFVDFSYLPSDNSLEEFILDGNTIGDVPENALSNLTRLRSLQLSNLGISRWPNLTAQMTSLLALDLSSNLLTSIPDGALDRFSISQLYLQRNRLTSLLNLFPLSGTLGDLNVADNELGPMPCKAMVRFITSFTKLSYLDISNVGLVTFPHISLLQGTIVSYLYLLNPHTMHCDCSLAWLTSGYQLITDFNDDSTPCASPARLVGRRWGNITRDDLCADGDNVTCEDYDVTPTLTSPQTTPPAVTTVTEASTSVDVLGAALGGSLGFLLLVALVVVGICVRCNNATAAGRDSEDDVYNTIDDITSAQTIEPSSNAEPLNSSRPITAVADVTSAQTIEPSCNAEPLTTSTPITASHMEAVINERPVESDYLRPVTNEYQHESHHMEAAIDERPVESDYLEPVTNEYQYESHHMEAVINKRPAEPYYLQPVTNECSNEPYSMEAVNATDPEESYYNVPLIDNDITEETSI